MQDDPILEELRSLPRERPRTGFAERVLARLDETPRPTGPFVPAWPRWAVAGLALCAAAGWSLHRSEAVRERRQQMAALRVEGAQLAAELAALRDSVAAGPAEVIYLGGDEGVDYVIDLARLAQRRAVDNVAPASYRAGSGN